MKKIAVLFLVAFSSLTAVAQKAVTFKVAYKPNTVYVQNIAVTAKNEISYKASEDILEALKAQGITNPTVTDNKTTTTNILTTGKLTANEMPVTMKVVLDNGTETKIIPDNTMIYGKIKQDGQPVFDSINAPGMEATLKNIFMKSLQSTMAQILIPEKKVKTGESITFTQPLSIPIGPGLMNINDVAVYKLIKVEGIKAYFDVSHTYTIDTNVEGQQIKGTGFGTGKVIHDLTNNYILNQDLTMSMQMAFDTNGITLNIKSDTIMSLDCIISAAK